MRKNNFSSTNKADFKDFHQADFNEQQNIMKNNIQKKYQIKILTSFNERTVCGLIGINQSDSFYAIDKNYGSQISLDALKQLF